MSALRSRLKALEDRNPSSDAKRVYTLVGGGEDDDVAAFIRSEGWAFDDELDLAIRLVPIEPDFRDGKVHGPLPAKPSEYPLRFMRQPSNLAWRLEAA